MYTPLLSGPELQKRTYKVRQKAEEIWKQPLHRHYTFHGLGHSERVIEMLEKLLEQSQEPPTDDECYVLVCAALLHDIGMQDERFLERDLVKERITPGQIRLAESDPETREQIMRDCHHLVSEERIVAELGDRFLEPEFIDQIAEVVRAHTRESLDSCEDQTKGSSTVRVRFLAGLLRLADELDCDFTRVNLAELEQSRIPIKSQAHWWKCHCVDGVTIDTDGRIQFSFRFAKEERDEVENIIPVLVITGLEEKLRIHRVLDVLRSYVRLSVDAAPKAVRRGHGKRRVPERVVDVLSHELTDLMVRRATQSIEPISAFATGRLKIAIGEVPENLLHQAVELAGRGEKHAAISLLRKATSLYPGSAPLHAFLADQLVQEELWDEALTVAQKTVTSWPMIILGQLTLGISLAQNGDHAQALAHLRIVDFASHVSHLPETDVARMHLAIAACLYGLGDCHYAMERVLTATAAHRGVPIGPSGWLETRAHQIESMAQRMRTVTHEPSLEELTFEEALGQWRVDRPYVYEQADPQILPEGIALGGSADWIDYDFECEFQIFNRAAGFFARADAWGTTGIMMQLTPTMLRVHQLRHSDYSAGPLIEVHLPAPIELCAWHTVRFEVRGNNLMAWIDQKPIEAPVEVLPMYRSGRVGFRLWGREFTMYKNPRVTVTKRWAAEQD